MADTYVVTEQTNWKRLTSSQSTWFAVNGASLSDPSGYLHTKTLWTTDMDPGEAMAGHVVLTGVPESGSVAFKFYCSGSSGDTGEARIWGISRLSDATDTDYMAEFLCTLDLTAGTSGVASGGSDILPVCKFVDTIDVVKDCSLIPGGRVISQVDNSAPAVVLDGLGYWGYIVEIAPKVPTSTDWGALYRVF